MNEVLIVIGAGGHGKVVAASALSIGYQIVKLYDDAQELWGTRVLGCEVVGPPSAIRADDGGSGVIGIGSNTARREIAMSLSLPWVSLVHPSSQIHPSVQVGAGTVVFAGGVIQPDSVLGEHVIVNTGAIVDHDCRLGDFAHVAPGARLAGGVMIGDSAFVGIGASVVPGVQIGSGASVGAGAAVIHDVPPNTTVVGVPARPLGQ